MTRIHAQGPSSRADERLPLRLLSIQPQMVRLPHHKSLYPAFLMAFHVFFLNQSSKRDAEAMGE